MIKQEEIEILKAELKTKQETLDQEKLLEKLKTETKEVDSDLKQFSGIRKVFRNPLIKKVTKTIRKEFDL